MKNKLTVTLGLLWLITLSVVLCCVHLQTRSELLSSVIETADFDSGILDTEARDYIVEITEVADCDSGLNDIDISDYAVDFSGHISTKPRNLDALYYRLLERYPDKIRNHIDDQTDILPYSSEIVVEIDAEIKLEEEEVHDTVETVPSVYKVSIGIFELTAYCPCAKCCGEWSASHISNLNTGFIQKTTSGTIPREGRTISVDPRIIPLGTELVIDDKLLIAEDTGSAIKGYRIDVYFDDHQEALEFGRQKTEVFGFKDCCGDWITQQAYIDGIQFKP